MCTFYRKISFATSIFSQTLKISKFISVHVYQHVDLTDLVTGQVLKKSRQHDPNLKFNIYKLVHNLIFLSSNLSKRERSNGDRPPGFKNSQTFYEQLFLHERILRSFSPLTVWLCNSLQKEYWRKSC